MFSLSWSDQSSIQRMIRKCTDHRHVALNYMLWLCIVQVFVPLTRQGVFMDSMSDPNSTSSRFLSTYSGECCEHRGMVAIHKAYMCPNESS